MLQGVVEADETYFLRSSKGQRVQERNARHRGGNAAKRGLSEEQERVLVARDRSGATADFILERSDKALTVGDLAPVLARDAVLCTDCGGALGAAAKQLGVEQHALNISKGPARAGRLAPAGPDAWIQVQRRALAATRAGVFLRVCFGDDRPGVWAGHIRPPRR